MMGDRAGTLINRIELVKNNQGGCVVDIFKHDSSLPPITFSFFAIINCNNTQRQQGVGRARRDLMRPKCLDYTLTAPRLSLPLEAFFIHSFYTDVRRDMDECYYNA